MGLLFWIFTIVVIAFVIRWFMRSMRGQGSVGHDASAPAADAAPERPLPGQSARTEGEVRALNDGKPGVDTTGAQGGTAEQAGTGSSRDGVTASGRDVGEIDGAAHHGSAQSGVAADGVAAAAGAEAITGAGAAAAMTPAERTNAPKDPVPGTPADRSSTHPGSTAARTSNLPTAQAALTGDFTVKTADAAYDVREMLKILNLRDSDAKRLEISADEYQVLKSGEPGSLPAERVGQVAERLRAMIL